MLHIGTSGWQYADWRRAFYRGLPTARWLEAYSSAFATVEVNSTFYRLPGEGTLGKWAAATPDDFVFVIKASRYLTHIKRMAEPRQPVALLAERTAELGSKLGPILVQLPPSLRRDERRLEALLAAFEKATPGARVAFEPRHDSWHAEPVYEILRRHDAALCWWDRDGQRGPLERTASWIYLRLHQGRASPSPCYGSDALKTWSERILEHSSPDVDGYVFFNNDHRACAPR